MDENAQNSALETPPPMVSDPLCTPGGQAYLHQTRPWVRFISILTFVSACFTAIAGIALIAISLLSRFAGFANQDELAPLSQPGFGVVTGMAYLAMAILYVPAGIFLGRYAGAISFFESSRTTEALEDALKQQKSFWRYAGILTIVCIAVAIFAFFFLILFSLFRARTA